MECIQLLVCPLLGGLSSFGVSFIGSVGRSILIKWPVDQVGVIVCRLAEEGMSILIKQPPHVIVLQVWKGEQYITEMDWVTIRIGVPLAMIWWIINHRRCLTSIWHSLQWLHSVCSMASKAEISISRLINVAVSGQFDLAEMCVLLLSTRACLFNATGRQLTRHTDRRTDRQTDRQR